VAENEAEVVEEFEGADVAYDVAVRRLEEQMRQIDHIDTKVTVVLTTASAAAAIFATVSIAALKTASNAPLVIGVLATVAVGGIYLVLAHFALRAYRLYEWDLRPNWRQLIENSQVAPNGLMRSWVAANCVASLEANQSNVDKKIWRVGRAYLLLEVEAAAALAGILAIIFADRVLS